MTRKVTQNTRPSFSHVREGLGTRLSLLILTLLHTHFHFILCFSHSHSIPHVSHIPTTILLSSVFPFHPCLSLSLQSFLKGIYVSWITSKLVDLEPLIAELLTDMRLPSINCLPIKKPFGALKEVVLHPIHEDTTLPYTSTAAIQLLRSIGRTNLEFSTPLTFFIGFSEYHACD